MAFFILTLRHGSGWDDTRPIREQERWDEHAAFMDGLVDEGLILLGGPLGDGDRTLHVVQATDEAEVVSRWKPDPWAQDGHLEVGKIEPWRIWLDGRGFNQPQ
jgi:uncharacterized protein YciI